MIFPYICESIGTLRYSEGTQGPRCVLEVDPEIARYVRSMIPKYHHVKQPMYAPHITVIRHEKPSRETWAAHDNSQIMFWYNPLVFNDEIYWWLNVRCPRLSEIRTGLGLSPTRFTPQDSAGGFHMTIGNTK
jgi:hypothetical protein